MENVGVASHSESSVGPDLRNLGLSQAEMYIHRVSVDIY